MRSLQELQEREDLKISPEKLKKDVCNYLENVSREQLIKDLESVGCKVEKKEEVN